MQNLKENFGIKGKYIITVADVVTAEARKLQERIEKWRERGRGDKALPLIRLLNEKYGHKPLVIENLVPTVGRSVLAQRLANTTTYTGIVNYVALGSGSTAPANADTQLTTEVYRKAISSSTYANNIAYITGFFTAAETSGTYAEVGLFIDGTATANSGQIFSHALASITKTSVQTLTIDWVVTIS